MLNSALQKISGGWSAFYLAISVTAFTTAMAVTTFLPAAWAQTAPNVGFPNKPIRLVSGASAGSASDVVARSISNALQNDLGVSVVVETAPARGAWSRRDIFWLPQRMGILCLCTPRRTL